VNRAIRYAKIIKRKLVAITPNSRKASCLVGKWLVMLGSGWWWWVVLEVAGSDSKGGWKLNSGYCPVLLLLVGASERGKMNWAFVILVKMSWLYVVVFAADI